MNQKQTIKSKAIHGMMWSSAGSLIFQAIRILTQVILARLLWPEAFGLIALVMAFVSVLNYLVDNGLTLFLVRKQELEENDAYSLFVSNFVFAIGMMILLVISSPWIAVYLEEPSIALLLSVSSVAIVINASGSVHKALLTRELRFKEQTLGMLIATLVAGFIAILSSVLGAGVWSLVIYNLGYQLLFTGSIILIYPLKISGQLNRLFIRSAVFYSWKLMLSGLIHTVYENIFNIIMGMMFSVSTLGFYSNALKIRDGAAQTLTDAIQKVSFPVLSKMQNDKTLMLETNRRILRLSLFVIYPILIGLAATSSSIVQVVFTELWFGMIPIMQILAINGLLIPLHRVNLNILTVIGRTDLYLRLEIYKKIIAFITLSIAIILSVDIQMFLWVLFFNALLGYIINVHYSKQFLNYGFRKQLLDIGPVLFVSIIMGVSVWMVPILFSINGIVLLLVQIMVGLLNYVMLSYLLLNKEFMILWQIMLSFLKRKEKAVQ